LKKNEFYVILKLNYQNSKKYQSGKSSKFPGILAVNFGVGGIQGIPGNFLIPVRYAM